MAPKQHEHLLSNIDVHLRDPIDIFVCCSSFEDRCLVLPSHINKALIKCAIVAENKNNLRYVGQNGESLRQLFGLSVMDVSLSTDDAIATEASLLSAIGTARAEGPQSVLVDITTFTRESLLILLNLLVRSFREDDVIKLAYIGAKGYSLDSQPEATWLSKGVREIRSVLGFPGALVPSQKRHLIVLVGFEDTRVETLVEEYQPTQLSLGYGTETTSITPEHFTINKMFIDKLKARYGEHVSVFRFPPDDIFGTMAEVISQSKTFIDMSTVVTPMNTKLSTVGAGFAALTHQEIQIAYAQAELYNTERYSAPKDTFFLFDITNQISEYIQGRVMK